MNPTSSELITAIADTLRTRIAPLLADQPWPASELRSIDALLSHLAARVDHEHTVLYEDNTDLDTVLAELADAGIDVTVPESSSDNAGTPESTASLHAGNLARRTALEAAIHRIHDGADPRQVERVRDYLRRAAAREQLIFGPFATKALF